MQLPAKHSHAYQMCGERLDKLIWQIQLLSPCYPSPVCHYSSCADKSICSCLIIPTTMVAMRWAKLHIIVIVVCLLLLYLTMGIVTYHYTYLLLLNQPHNWFLKLILCGTSVCYLCACLSHRLKIINGLVWLDMKFCNC